MDFILIIVAVVIGVFIAVMLLPYWKEILAGAFLIAVAIAFFLYFFWPSSVDSAPHILSGFQLVLAWVGLAGMFFGAICFWIGVIWIFDAVMGKYLPKEEQQ